jgi:hypothetical protein
VLHTKGTHMKLYMKYDSLVLLGVGNSGKDTVYQKFANLQPNSVNIKFSSFSKHLLGWLMGIPQDYFENKELRTQYKVALDNLEGSFEYRSPVCLLDLVNALYFGGERVPTLLQAGVEYAHAQVTPDCFPVFTDIRRQHELDSVLQKYTPLVVLLKRTAEQESATDENVIGCFNSCAAQQKITLINLEPDRAAAYIHAFVNSYR